MSNNVNADDIFAEFGFDVPENVIQVSQRVGTINVEESVEEIDAIEVEPILLGNSPNEIDDTDSMESNEAMSEETEETEDTYEDNSENDSVSEESIVEMLNEVEISTESTNLLIEPNAKDIVRDTTVRFSGATWYEAIQKSSIILAGLGGIGSYVSFLLSRMRPRALFLYDDDVVESVNLSGQLYGLDHINQPKVDASSNIAEKFSNYRNIFAFNEKFTEYSSSGNIMICGFDSMTARMSFFNSWKKHLNGVTDKSQCLFIDGRLAAEEFQVFCIKGDDTFNIQKYEREYLFSDLMSEATLCSYKQTTYCANMIGSVIVNLFTNFIANTLNPVIERALPFKTTYNASLMYFKSEE